MFVTTDGSAEISKRDASKSLPGSKYKVKNWIKQGSASEDASASAPEEKMKSNLLAESQDWTNAAGTTITAAVQKVEGGKVYFIMPNGSSVPYPASKLSPETIAKIKELVN